MEYDVTGTLKIDTEAFEKALKDAQKRIDNFKKDLESLGNIAKEIGFPELDKSLKDLNKQLDNVEVDFGNIGKSADNVTNSVKDLKKESTKVEESVKTLDEYFDQSTTSAEKLTAETKRIGAEVDALQRRISKIKLDKSFTKDFYSAVRSAEGGTGVELKPIYENLKKDYKDLVKNKAEFDKLFSNAVRRTNTRLYPTRDPDKHTMVSGRNFGYIDRKSLISLDEFNKLMDKADAKVKQLNAETERSSLETEELARDWRTVGNELLKAEDKLLDLNAEMRKLSYMQTNGKNISPALFDRAREKFEEQKKVVNELTSEFNNLKKAGNVPKLFIEPTKELSQLNEQIEKLRAKSEKLFGVLNGFEPFEGTSAEFKKMEKEYDVIDRELNQLIFESSKLEQKLKSANLTEPVDELREVVFKTTEEIQAESKQMGESINKGINEGTSKATEGLKKAGAEAEKLKQKLKSVFNPLTNRQSIAMLLQKSEQDEANQINSIMEKNRQKINQLKEEMSSVAELWDDLGIKLHKAQTGLDKYGEGNRWSKKWAEDLKTIPPEIDKVKAKYESLEEEIWELEQENKILSKEYSQAMTQFTKPIQSLMSESEKLGKMVSTPFKEVSSESAKATTSVEKLNAEMKEVTQFISPDKSLNDLNNELLDAYGKYYDLKNEAHRIREEESGSVEELKKATTEVKKQREEVKKLEGEFRKAQDNVRRLVAPLDEKRKRLEKMLYGDQKPSPYDDGVMVGTTGMKQSLTEARAEYRELLKQKKELQAEIDKIIADNGGVLTPEITEANKKLFEELHHIDSLRQDRLEDMKSYPKEIERVQKKIEQLDKEISSYYNDAGKYLEGMGEGAKLGEEKLSEFDAKLKQQHEGLDNMVNESTTKATEGIKKVETTFSKGTENILAQIKKVQSAGQGIYKFFRGNANLNTMGKWFPPQMYSQPTNRWVHEQLEVTRNFMKNASKMITAQEGSLSKNLNRMYGKNSQKSLREIIALNERYFSTTKKISASTNVWVHESIDGFNKFARAVQKSVSETERLSNVMEKYKMKLGLIEKYQYQPTGNVAGVGFAGSSDFQKAIEGAERYVAELKKVEMQAKKTAEAQRMLTQQYQYNKTGNVAGVGFAGSNQFQQMNKGLQEYNRLSNVANLNTQRMGLGFEKFGQYSKQAESNVRSLSGVFRTLRTTMSMIGGMFVWEFAFKIMDATKSTISAKSEMESYYKTLHMGSKEIASFNKSLDNTVSQFQKMNKFQLGETISALGVEFKMSTDEMNQIMKVAPMIVNEYLRAGRSTEEAILAIKDISQGEFLRLSRETGVGQKEIKDAGWNGDNTDILSLYKALEKIGKARHWDVFASKATSLNDVMLITENRMTEFATLLSDAVTPIIVGSFNALGDAFNSASRWYEGLGSYDKAIVQMTTLGTVGLTTAGVFDSHLLPAIKNFGTNIISSFLGVDSAIVKEKGLAQAIAHETAVERIANIERKGGQKVLHSKIMTLKAEELANKLGMNTTKLRMRYENLQQVAMKRGTTELKARELAQRSLILAEEQNITTTQAMNILLEEEALAEMGTAKALLVRKLGLDATIVSEEGMIVALNERIAQSFPFISSLVSETLATIGLESATATLVVTLGLMIAPLIAIGVAIAPLIANFIDLQKSYEELADTFDNGQQRIDELEQKQKGYQKTIDELSNKTNLTAQEEAKLQEARDGLTYTTEALEDATNRYNKSVEYTHIVNKNIEKVEGMRAKNLKEINKELEKQTGKKETIDSSYGMTTAYKEQYRTLQVIAWEENHRPERFKKLSESIKATSKDQEEYNKKIQEFGNDWNQAYSDMEDAQLKRIDPNADAFTRLWSYFDESWAIAKMDWIEFWADPFASISGELGFDGLSQSFNSALTQMGQDWDNFWQPITDFFNNFSVDADFDPFAGLKDEWNDTNAWLDSIMPDISVDSIKDWVKTNIKEPFQKAFREFMKDPLGGGDEKKQGQTGGTATKSINLASLFKFDFGGLKTGFTKGITSVLSGASPVLRGAGELWARISNNNGLKVVSSARQGLSGLKQALTQKFNEGQAVISRTASSWGKSAYNTGNSIYSNLKTGVGDLASLIRSKFKGIKEAIDGAKKGISNSVKALADAITSPLSGLKLPSIGFGGGFYGSRRSVGGRIRMPRVNQPVYGSSPSSMGFDTVLATMLTEQGFRSPSSYQFYPNSQKSVQEAWDTGKANCFDGARVILALASMFGLKGHMVTGTWNGTGHSGAVIGGKLYDMTQFQRRGVFRGTAGVHFGSSQQRSYGAGKQENNKIININVTNDLSNARIYGMDDLDNHIKQTTEKTFYELNSVDGAIGY